MSTVEDREWRKRVDERFQHVETRLDQGEKRFAALEARSGEIEDGLTRNTTLTERAVTVSECTDEKVDRLLLEFREVSSFIKNTRLVSRMIGWVAKWTARALNRLARWAVPIIAAGAGAWAWWQSFRPPK